MRTLAAGLVLSLAVVSPCVAQTPTQPPTADVRAVAGCYAVSAGEWSPPDPNVAWHRIPPLIRLDTTPSLRQGGWALSPNISYPNHGAFPGTPRWTLVADTLGLVWSNGYQPTLVKLTRQDSIWVGEAVAESDFVTGAPLPRARVTARRAACQCLVAEVGI